MFNQPYMPGYFSSAAPNMARGASMIPGAAGLGRAGAGAAAASKGAGLFGRLGGAFGAIKSFNWGGLINNTSKTLGIINQAIPIVRQVRPMVHNVQSMMKVASIFKDETDGAVKKNINRGNNDNYEVHNNYENKVREDNNLGFSSYNASLRSNSSNGDESPTFFVN